VQVAAATFTEEVNSNLDPVTLPIAESFGLMDFDSAGPFSLPFSVRINFANAIDGLENEGLTFSTSGTSVNITKTNEQGDQVAYILQGGTTYQEYQQVSCEFTATCVFSFSSTGLPVVDATMLFFLVY